MVKWLRDYWWFILPLLACLAVGVLYASTFIGDSEWNAKASFLVEVLRWPVIILVILTGTYVGNYSTGRQR